MVFPPSFYYFEHCHIAVFTNRLEPAGHRAACKDAGLRLLGNIPAIARSLCGIYHIVNALFPAESRCLSRFGLRAEQSFSSHLPAGRPLLPARQGSILHI